MKADLIVQAGTVLTCGTGGGPCLGREMDDPGVIENGAFAVLNGRLAEVGAASAILGRYDGKVVEYPHSTVLPGLVDPHTHPIFAGSRTDEFLMRAKGATYEEIHAAGGGIARTVTASRQATDAELEKKTRRNLLRMLAHGTTTAEAKSGYGLNTGEELRELRILNKLAQELPLDLEVTFLGAHAVPEEYAGRADDYTDLVINEMLPLVKKENLAKWVDVFCENGAFSVEQSRRILQAGSELGLGMRIHAEEFANLGSARMAASLGASSADHLQSLDESDFPALAESGIIPIMTPGTSFFLGQGKYAPGRKMIDANLPVALATDFNPGSNFTLSMPMAISLAVLRLKFTPAEAIVAATINSACSLKRGHDLGSLEKGKQADFIVIDTDDWREWPYAYGVNMVSNVYKKGQLVYAGAGWE